MPEICRFFGIVITMYYNDHQPPHFHVRDGEQRAIVSIETLTVLEGRLSPRTLGLVTEWAAREEIGASQEDQTAGVSVMLKDIVEARPSGGYRLFVRFEDGVQGEVDLETIIQFEGVFASLKDRTEFARVSVNQELGTVCWPSGADLDPDVLYAIITNSPIPDFNPHSPAR